MSSHVTTSGQLEPTPSPVGQVLYIAATLVATAALLFAIMPTLGHRVLANNFMPHLYCYAGNQGLLWTHVVADLLIGLSYFAISATLIYLVQKGRRDIPFQWMLLAFGAFIVACGTTHFMEIVTAWVPVYVLSASVKVVTAMASVTTAVLLPFSVPHVLALIQSAKATREAEALLGESEDRYRDLVEHSQDLLCTHDLKGKLLSCNPAPARILGYEVAELLKLPMRVHLAPESREGFDEYLARIASAGVNDGLLTVVTRTGERRIWEYHNTLRTEGVSSPVVRGMARDITERALAERSAEMFRMLIDQSNDAIEVINPETLRFLDINDRACANLGYSRDELLGMTVFDIDPNAHDSFAEVNDKLQDSGAIVFESQHRRKDGSTFPVEVSIKQVHLDRVYNIAVTRDISERKQAEEALRAVQDKLARVAPVAAMGELTSSIAHEIRQPLAAVAANAGASLRWLAAQPPNLGEARSAISQAVQEVSRATGVIERMRALLQKAQPQLKPLDGNEVIRETVVFAERELQKNGVKVETALASDIPAVPGDRIQLQQVMVNLILNAIDAMQTVSGRPRKLTLRSARQEQGVLIEVEDSGRGLDGEQADRIFEPFFTTKAGGIGLGLAISRSIIEAHGGRLWATPAPTHGAIFRFTLPGTDDIV